jgi:hypothetical protein
MKSPAECHIVKFDDCGDALAEAEFLANHTKESQAIIKAHGWYIVLPACGIDEYDFVLEFVNPPETTS